MTPQELFRLGSVLVLALLLFFPVSRIIWVFSVRRLHRRIDRSLSEDEISGQMRRARFIGLFVSLVFSWLFHLQIIFRFQ